MPASIPGQPSPAEASVGPSGESLRELNILDRQLSPPELPAEAPTVNARLDAVAMGDLSQRGGFGSSSGPNLAPASPPPLPAELVQVPGYEVLGVLGRGGMGVVYKARQINLNRFVALKMILAGAHAAREDLERFRREAEAVARFQHPNIVQVYDVGEHEGRPFLSLEFVAGGSLARRLDGQPTTPRKAARLAETIARAVDAAHSRGIIHRDLKPGNILLTEDGTPKIADFGLAKFQDGEGGHTQHDGMIGTPSYMPPEQVDGRLREISAAADVYSLGAILYELLTGRPPFRAATPIDTAVQVVNQEPVAPTKLQSGIPRDLETICLKCLAKSPAKRYPSALALADDLARFIAGTPILARPTTFWERGLKWVRRRPAAATLVALLGLVPVGGFLGLLWQLEQSERRREAATADLQQQADDYYLACIALADLLWQRNETARAEDVLERCPSRFRDWEWHYLTRSWRARQLSRQVIQAGPIQFQRDGQLLTIATSRGDAKIRDAKPGDTVKMIMAAGSAAVISGDGGLFALTTTSRNDNDGHASIEVRDTATSSLRQRLPVDIAAVRPICFSSNGKALVILTKEGALSWWDLSSGREIRKLQPANRRFANAAVAAGIMATVTVDGVVEVWDEETGKAAWSVFAPRADSLRETAANAPSASVGVGAPAAPLAVSRNGNLVAFAGGDQVQVWDRQAQKKVGDFHSAGRVREIAFSPNGKQLAAAGSEGVVMIWDVRSSKELFALRGHAGVVREIAFSPDGRRLAAVDQDSVQIWDVTPQEEIRLHGFHDQLTSHAVSADGNILAAASPTGELSIWETSAGKKLRDVAGLDGPVRCLALSPYGRLLAASAEGGTIKAWPTAEGKAVLNLKLPGGPVSALAINANAKLLVCASSGQPIRIVDIATGRELRAMKSPNQDWHHLAIGDEDGCMAASTSEGIVRLWPSAKNSEGIEINRDGAPLTSLAFSGKGQSLVAGDVQGSLTIWNARNGEERARMRGHAEPIAALTINPDGSRLATAGADGIIELWDLKRMQPIMNLGVSSSRIVALTFTADGNRLIAVGRDGTIKTWDGTPQTSAQPELAVAAGPPL